MGKICTTRSDSSSVRSITASCFEWSRSEIVPRKAEGPIISKEWISYGSENEILSLRSKLDDTGSFVGEVQRTCVAKSVCQIGLQSEHNYLQSRWLDEISSSNSSNLKLMPLLS